MTNEIRIMHLQNRLHKLNQKPIENANLIRKVKRELKKFEN